MPTYFGYNVNGTSTDSGNGGGVFWHNPAKFVYTRPGSGNQTIKELSAYVRYGSASGKHLIVGIYSAAGVLICKSQSVSITNSALAWVGTTAPSLTSPANCNLVGGTQYILACGIEDDDTVQAQDGYSAGGAFTSYSGFTFSNGLPATLPSPDGAADYKYCIRCGVDPASSGSFVPLSRRTFGPRIGSRQEIAA